VIAAGERVPAVQVWIDKGSDGFALDELVGERPFLLLFYVFDWSTT